MSSEMAIKDGAAVLERVITVGDLEQLTPAERVMYYRSVCESLGLNPLTRPFEFLKLSGKMVLYARKDATEQLRTKRAISITKLVHEVTEGMYIVTASAKDSHGREDSDLGVVPIDNLRGEARANAIMKATTKAKRRVTLSICGLGMLDESEVDSIQGARRIAVDMETGEILEGGASPADDAGREVSDRPEPRDTAAPFSPVPPPPQQRPADKESETLRSILLGDISKLGDRLFSGPGSSERKKFHWVRFVGQTKVADATMEQLQTVHDGLLEMLTEGKAESRARS